MKTLSHYQKLREDYACIIPKTAPAYELIEAIDDLIKLLQPKEEQPHFLGVPVNLPKGWVITLFDHRGDRRGSVYRNFKGEYAIWWDGKRKTTLRTQQDAIKWLNREVNKS